MSLTATWGEKEELREIRSIPILRDALPFWFLLFFTLFKNKDPCSKLRGIQRKSEFPNPPNPLCQRGNLSGHPVASYGEPQVQS